jgi:long-chain acyl-CoA synthetase
LTSSKEESDGGRHRRRPKHGSKTIAELLPKAAEKFGDHTAARHKAGDDWTDVSFRDVGVTVTELALGLIDLGIQKGDRVSLLANTRPEWAYASFASSSAGALSSDLPSNSPSECEWVAGNSESVAIFCEDAKQVAKILEVRRAPARTCATSSS